MLTLLNRCCSSCSQADQRRSCYGCWSRELLASRPRKTVLQKSFPRALFKLLPQWRAAEASADQERCYAKPMLILMSRTADRVSRKQTNKDRAAVEELAKQDRCCSSDLLSCYLAAIHWWHSYEGTVGDSDQCRWSHTKWSWFSVRVCLLSCDEEVCFKYVNTINYWIKI